MTTLPRPWQPLGSAWLRRLVATGSVALVLALSVFAASPQLHRWLHPDADQPGHECAITLFHHGVVGAAVGLAVAVTTWVLVASVPIPPAEPDLIAPRFRLRPGRAPPAC